MQEVSDLREIDKSVKAFIQTKIPPQEVLQEKLNSIKEDRIGNALIPHKYFPSQIPIALRCLPNVYITVHRYFSWVTKVCPVIFAHAFLYYTEHLYVIAKQSIRPKDPNCVFSTSNEATID